ncbi:dynamin family protein [Virgibacillus flavescens]|uniref:dynamin family protein n=1 Tax=Virgibacillus flavescens TaxID=1611422 RepID=UPI003D356D30
MDILKDHYQPISKDHFASLYTLFLNQGDAKQAENLLDLYEKMNNNEFIISFAGHFSAGKSSIINEILGKSMLPQSPIPTSANLVKLNTGDGFVRVHFHQENTIEYSEPYDINVIKAYCQDKDTIKKIEISSSDSILPPDTAIMDTPGIDAADDADRLLTEGSLHVVDVIFYVMDYNHVQSEVNLEFLQGIQEKNIPFFLIINQIDKHNDDELAFSTYKDKIKQTFDQWEIYPESMFYTSLKNESISTNQFNDLKRFINELVTTKKDAYYSLDRSVKQIIEDHTQFVEDQHNEVIETIKSETDDFESNIERTAEIKSEITNLRNRANEFDKEFHQVINSTLQNAYIMPATLRDQATAYLESRQPEFKIGLIGSKKKTETERNRRLNDFLHPLLENSEKFIQWKIRDKIVQLMKDYHVTDPQSIQEVQNLSIDFTDEDLESLINPGATVNGKSLLNYTTDVSNEIKEKYKKKTIKIEESLLLRIKDQNSEQIQTLQSELIKLENATEANNKIADLKNDYDKQIKKLTETFLNPSPASNDQIKLEESMKERSNVTKQDTPLSVNVKENSSALIQNNETDGDTANFSVERVVDSINQTIEVTDSIPGFDQIISELKNKRDKLSNRSFTITLFGAFSAGKSSFANALIGDSVLPVSPNPTTAAINRVAPVTRTNQHGSVIVTLKKEPTIIKDCLALLKGYGPETESLENLYNWLVTSDISELPKTQQQYLQAIVQGYEFMKNHIGEQIESNVNHFSIYVTDETKACFVESIDLYYDCHITQQGITLVDTPGADSVNARHTNVAFDYIKHADAILYVTYYNHALSRADKDFLMQLGRVKESFELDKMFFIINAADLAEDKQELTLVENYVNEQLLQLGIRFPKLFPISSRTALANKLAKESLNDYMYHFENQFYQFIHHDLTKLSIESALWDMDRAYTSIKSYVSSVKMSEQNKMQRKESLLEKKDNVFQVIDTFNDDSYLKAISQKIDKQLYYVLDRLAIRFHDMFKEMFNPTTIRESGKAGRVQMESSMRELLDYVGYELLQELRAVALRVESLIREQVGEINNLLSDKVKKIDGDFSLPNDNEVELLTPEFNQAFNELELTVFNKALTTYKGTKSFFEKNEKEQIKESIFSILQPQADKYIAANKKLMIEAYADQWSSVMNRLKKANKESIGSYIDGLLHILSNKNNELELNRKENELSIIMKRYEDR